MRNQHPLRIQILGTIQTSILIVPGNNIVSLSFQNLRDN